MWGCPYSLSFYAWAGPKIISNNISGSGCVPAVLYPDILSNIRTWAAWKNLCTLYLTSAVWPLLSLVYSSRFEAGLQNNWVHFPSWPLEWFQFTVGHQVDLTGVTPMRTYAFSACHKFNHVNGPIHHLYVTLPSHQATYLLYFAVSLSTTWPHETPLSPLATSVASRA